MIDLGSGYGGLKVCHPTLQNQCNYLKLLTKEVHDDKLGVGIELPYIQTNSCRKCRMACQIETKTADRLSKSVLI